MTWRYQTRAEILTRPALILTTCIFVWFLKRNLKAVKCYYTMHLKTSKLLPRVQKMKMQVRSKARAEWVGGGGGSTIELQQQHRRQERNELHTSKSFHIMTVCNWESSAQPPKQPESPLGPGGEGETRETAESPLPGLPLLCWLFHRVQKRGLHASPTRGGCKRNRTPVFVV